MTRLANLLPSMTRRNTRRILLFGLPLLLGVSVFLSHFYDWQNCESILDENQRSSCNPSDSTAAIKSTNVLSSQSIDDTMLLMKLKEDKYKQTCGTILGNIILKGTTSWEAPTCRKKDYTSSETRMCLSKKDRTIAMVGDSRMRQLYKTFCNLADNVNEDTVNVRENGDLQFAYGNSRILFYWHRWANEDAYNQVSEWLSNTTRRPDILLIGMGTSNLETEQLTSADETKATAFSAYQGGLKILSLLLDELGKRMPIVWLGQGSVKWPTVHTTEEYNAAAKSILNRTSVTYWNSAYQISRLLFHDIPDLIHYSNNTAALILDIFLNYYCNAKMGLNESYCCSGLEQTDTSVKLLS